MSLKISQPFLNFSNFTKTEQRFLSIAQAKISFHFDNLLPEVGHKYSHFIEINTLKSVYIKLIADKILLLVSRAAVLELNLARQLEELVGETPEKRFDIFFTQLDTNAFFKQYPVLNRLLDTFLIDFNGYLLEIFENYATEWHNLFPVELKPPTISNIKTILMDVYPNGRSVVILHLKMIKNGFINPVIYLSMQHFRPF